MRAGANIAGSIYQPHITSYDYDCPVSEAGDIGQPGIGGDNKFKVGAQKTDIPFLSMSSCRSRNFSSWSRNTHGEAISTKFADLVSWQTPTDLPE